MLTGVEKYVVREHDRRHPDASLGRLVAQVKADALLDQFERLPFGLGVHEEPGDARDGRRLVTLQDPIR